MRLAPAFLALSICTVLLPAAQAAENLAPHRGVYDLKLLSSRGMKGVEAANGRIVFEMSGNACVGYAVNFRQVTQLSGGETGDRFSDVRSSSVEDGEGRNFRFNNQTRFGSSPPDDSEGRAVLADRSLVVELREPVERKLTFQGDIIFPSDHTRRLIAAARKGERLLPIKIYDGSEKGAKVYDTLTVIGSRLGAEAIAKGEPAAKALEEKGLASWPMTVSYYEDGSGERTPIYTISFVIYENGVSRALKLDYGDFVLSGELKTLDLPEPSPCER
jgi:hypothetical protein